jgi:hypothetical protein
MKISPSSAKTSTDERSTNTVETNHAFWANERGFQSLWKTWVEVRCARAGAIDKQLGAVPSAANHRLLQRKR